jgi:small-conductance mechanosensitive channel
MLKVVLIGFLALVMLCMLPVMGSISHHSGHLHHDNSVSCASCMASVDLPSILVLLSLVGFATLALPLPPKLVAPGVQFHPPRSHA